MTNLMMQLCDTVSDELGTFQTAIRESDLLVALQELVEALDKRSPHLERAGEAQILADARRLRVSAIRRIAFLREHANRISSLHPPKRDDLKRRLAGTIDAKVREEAPQEVKRARSLPEACDLPEQAGTIGLPPV
jgi:hypothetical protein